MSLQLLSQAVDALVDTDPETLSDAESIEALHRELARLEAVVTRATGAFDTAGTWASSGARDAAAWLAMRCRLPRHEAARRARLGRRLARLPKFTRSWLAGEIGQAQAWAVAQMLRPGLSDAVERDEQLLADHARTLRFDWFRKALMYFEQLADPDGADAAELGRIDRRQVHLSESFSGMFYGQMTFDPVAGTIVSDELHRLDQVLFEADWADAAERLGRDPVTGDLRRTPAQRRADALVEMAKRSRTAPDDGRRPAPLFSVLVGYETLHGRICELAGGTVVSPVALLPWLDQALVERVVFGPGNRVEVGPAVRLYTGATRRAIEVRDRTCSHPYCDRPAVQCEIDHILPYSEGGPTTQENGRLLCAFHNRLRNQRPPPAAA